MEEMDKRPDQLLSAACVHKVVFPLMLKYNLVDLHLIADELTWHIDVMEEEVDHAQETMTIEEGTEYVDQVLANYEAGA